MSPVERLPNVDVIVPTVSKKVWCNIHNFQGKAIESPQYQGKQLERKATRIITASSDQLLLDRGSSVHSYVGIGKAPKYKRDPEMKDFNEREPQL